MQTKDSQSIESPKKVNISQQEAQAWKQEARKLGRSQSHLNKIDQTINNAPKTTIGNKPGTSLKREDALAMKKDRSDYQKLNLDKTQTQTVNQSKGIKR